VIIRAILLVFSSNLLAKILGFIITLIFAAKVGTTSAADAYTFAFVLPDLVNHIIAGSALSISFIPIFQGLSGDVDRQNRFFSNVFTVGTAVSFAVLFIAYIFAPILLRVLAGSSITGEEAVFSLTVKLTRIVLPAQLFFFWGSLFIGVQHANKQYKHTSLAAVLYNLLIIIFAVSLYNRLGIEAFAYGILSGAFFGHVIMQFIGAKRFLHSYKPQFDLRNKDLRLWFYNTLPLIFGLGVTFSNEFTFRFFGSRLEEGQGAIAALSYSYKIVMIVVVLFANSVASPVFPFLTQKANAKDYKGMEEVLMPIYLRVLCMIGAITVFLYLFAPLVIRILFARNAFDAESVEICTRALTGYLPGIIGLSSVIILSRLFYAIKDTKTPLLISTVSLILSLPFYKILGDNIGITGISLSTSIFSLIATLLTLYSWYSFRRKGR